MHELHTKNGGQRYIKLQKICKRKKGWEIKIGIRAKTKANLPKERNCFGITRGSA